MTTDYIKREDAIEEVCKGCNEQHSEEPCEPSDCSIMQRLADIPRADVIERNDADSEWCTDCKEYDNERHCCPRWNKVIRETMDEIRQNAEENWDKVEVVRCKDCKYHAEFSSKCNKLHLTPMRPNDYCSYGERAEA